MGLKVTIGATDKSLKAELTANGIDYLEQDGFIHIDLSIIQKEGKTEELGKIIKNQNKIK